MDKEQLKIRAEKRRKWAQTVDAQDSLVAEIGTAWLQSAVLKWNPTVQPKVPAGIPVGPEFIRFVKNWMKSNNFRTLEFGEAAVRAGAEAVANWIDFNGNRVVGVDYPNPLTEINKARGEGYMTIAAGKQTKTADTIYGPIDRERVGIYAEPFEWTRYCPDHPGVMMRRVKDGLYQCPMKGEVFSYTDGHDVEVKLGVQNQTNPNWNDTFPQKPFLHTDNQQSTRASGGTYDEDSEKEHPKYKENKDTKYVAKTSDLYANEGAMAGGKKEASLQPSIKQAKSELGIADKLFGPTTMHSRYCPDHPGVSLYRIADSVFQCPLDRSIYDYEKGFTTQDGKEHNGGSIAEMTPDWPEFYQQVHPFLINEGSKVKKFMKTGAHKKGLSNLRPYIPMAKQWENPNYPLDRAKEEFKEAIQKAFVGDPESIQRNLPEVEMAKTTQDLIKHFWNALMKGEGAGVSFPSKGRRGSLDKTSYTNLEYRLARDIDLALRGEESSKKVLGLIVDGVFKGKSFMIAAQEAYDFVEKANQTEPKTIEVQEQPQQNSILESENEPTESQEERHRELIERERRFPRR